MIPSFDKTIIANQLVGLSFFPEVEDGPVKTALRRMVAHYDRALRHGMKANGLGKNCHDAEMRLDAALQAAGMRRADIPRYDELQDVIDRILLLDIHPERRGEFYRSLCASRTVHG